MQAIVEPVVATPTTDETTARQVASQYIHTTLGAAYRLEPGFLRAHPLSSAWRFLVLNQEFNAVAGYVDVDAETGKIISLPDEQLQDLRERALVQAAKGRKTLARDAQGRVLPFLAKARVNGYLSACVAWFASANGQPALVNGNPPVWRVTTTLRLPEQDKVIELGVIDVNAHTGDVIPLTEQQIQHMQRCAEDAAGSFPHSTTATG